MKQKKKERKLSKRAFFIIGPESSGTRMMTQAFLSLGAYGDGGHAQRLDKEGFNGGHQMIALRRSVPHGQIMPKIQKTIIKMLDNGYEVIPIVIMRDKDKCARSQVKNKHAENINKARASINQAVSYIYRQLSNFDMHFHVMHYEPFVKYKKVREKFFQRFDLPHPDMEFYNANAQYK